MSGDGGDQIEVHSQPDVEALVQAAVSVLTNDIQQVQVIALLVYIKCYTSEVIHAWRLNFLIYNLKLILTLS